jgi:hypothetical protein
MKRYMVFAYDQYYPSGGMNDFKGDFDSLEDESYLNWIEQLKQSCDHIHVYDTVLRSRVVQMSFNY